MSFSQKPIYLTPSHTLLRRLLRSPTAPTKGVASPGQPLPPPVPPRKSRAQPPGFRIPWGRGCSAMWWRAVRARRKIAGARPASTAAAAAEKSCRAVVVPRFGGPEVLEVRQGVPVPDLKPREVLVRARAVSINPLDLRMRSGYGRSIFEPLLPLIIGRDISGEVAATGTSASSFSIGQEVFGALHPTALRGTYADYAILSVDELTLKPSTLSHAEASAIPFAALTAWRALHGTARISEGQRVLVVGGGGAVGLAAVQLAVAAGCEVSATCGPQSIERVTGAGAEQAIDYTTEDTEAAVKGKFDAVLDTIGVPETERIGINVLRRGGHYMTLQGEAAALADRYGLAVGLPAATAALLKKQMQYRYSHGIEYWWTYMRADPEGLHEIHRLSGAGKLQIPVEKTFPISHVREAHTAKEKKLLPGKVVLEFD